MGAAGAVIRVASSIAIGTTSSVVVKIASGISGAANNRVGAGNIITIAIG